jgi:FlaA1/EpsC-like NDP-sugar epimerase
MVVGAGDAGLLVAKEVATHPSLGIRAVGFVDDDASKLGTLLHGIPVLGTTRELRQVCALRGAEQVLIAIASATGSDIRRIAAICEDAEIPVKIIPGVSEIVGGKLSLSRIRPVAIEDILRRDPIKLDQDAISNDVNGRVVLVTGAGGSIGSELCRQICNYGPRRLLLVERAENNLFHIHRELAAAHSQLEIVPVLADVANRPRMQALFEKHRPELVLHAAAYKHVPMVEWNVEQAIINNVTGSMVVAKLAAEFEADGFVMVSTDKAVRPTSVMGASKRAAEIYVQSLASEGTNTRFVTVRFGNVLGSAGSVVPIFKDQIAKGGPVTVTHPDMTRYFMTVPEACELILQAGTMGQGGEIFILDMGDPVKIVDLAKDLIRLSGLRPDEDIEIVFTGIRPGEKLYEELSTEAELDTTTHPSIMVERSAPQVLHTVAPQFEALRLAALEQDERAVRDQLRELIPEFAGGSHGVKHGRPTPLSVVGPPQ